MTDMNSAALRDYENQIASCFEMPTGREIHEKAIDLACEKYGDDFDEIDEHDWNAFWNRAIQLLTNHDEDIDIERDFPDDD